MLDGEADSGLWAEFSDDAPSPDAGVEDAAPSDDAFVDDDVPDWDEPTGSEEPPEGITVESITSYLPLLMQRKYGDDWELLLADSDLGEAAVGEEVEAEERSYVDEVAVVEGDGQPGDPAEEAELMELVRQQAALGEEEEEEDEEAAQRADNDEFVGAVMAASPEGIADMLSASLSDFLIGRRDGTIPAPPEPFEGEEETATQMAQVGHLHESPHPPRSATARARPRAWAGVMLFGASVKRTP